VALWAQGCSSGAGNQATGIPDAGTDGPGQDAVDAGESPSTPRPTEPTVAATGLGEARGFFTDEGVVAFLGLPYAKPPVGELRFAPPVALHAWEGPVEAQAFGPACPQPEIEPAETLNSRIDEDCLTLNVWTPAADNKKRAVMFWIHGGGFIWESSGDLLYRGARVAARGDVVVVSVEYRLGSFGFSHLEEEPGSGNAGLLDQVLALRWVQQHIAAFGGDPDNVTIWGESAGSYSVTSILGLPSAWGLFHRAIAQSGGSSNTRRTDYAAQATRLLYEQAGVTTLEELRALPWQDVVRAQEGVMEASTLPDSIYGPVVDGVVFSEPPLSALSKGQSSNVPLLAGFTKDEGRWWLVDVPVLRTPLVTPAAMATFFPYLGRSIPEGKTMANANGVYDAAYPEYLLSPNLKAIAMTADVILRIPTLRQAETQLAHQPQNVFVYRFDWVPPSPEYPDLDLGALHGAELGFTMGYPEGWPEIYGEAGIPLGLKNQIMDAWLAFAKTGNPNHAGMPTWNPYNLNNRPTMLFNAAGEEATSALANDPDGNTRAFWDDRAFDGMDPPFVPEDLSGTNTLWP
jgi:para-nitrobenzyl esterase